MAALDNRAWNLKIFIIAGHISFRLASCEMEFRILPVACKRLQRALFNELMLMMISGLPTLSDIYTSSIGVDDVYTPWKIDNNFYAITGHNAIAYSLTWGARRIWICAIYGLTMSSIVRGKIRLNTINASFKITRERHRDGTFLHEKT